MLMKSSRLVAITDNYYAGTLSLKFVPASSNDNWFRERFGHEQYTNPDSKDDVN